MSTIKKYSTYFILLTLLLGFTFLAPKQTMASAEEASETPVPAEIQGLNNYIDTTADGIFSLDEKAALERGYSSEAINTVEQQLAVMNTLSRSKNSVVDSDNLTVTIFQPTSRTRGVNKYVVHWTGLTERWMDSDRAKAYIRGLETGGDISKFVPGWVGSVAKLYSASSIAQAKKAAKPGRGIIMFTQYSTTGTTTIPNVWYGQQ